MRAINREPHFAVIALGLLSCLVLGSSGCNVPRNAKPFVVQQDDTVVLASSEAAAKDAVVAFELEDVEPTKRQAIECAKKGKMTISANTSEVDLAPVLWRFKGMGYTCMVPAD